MGAERERALLEEIARLRAALGPYADPGNWSGELANVYNRREGWARAAVALHGPVSLNDDDEDAAA